MSNSEHVGWVIETYEDGSVQWWTNGDGWVGYLNDGADVFTDEEHGTLNLPLDGQWVKVYVHGGGSDGVLTTEPCAGRECPDCLDAARSVEPENFRYEVNDALTALVNSMGHGMSDEHEDVPAEVPEPEVVVVRVRLNDHFVFVGEMDAAGEDGLEIQINGRSLVGVRGDGQVITWNREGEADTTFPEGWVDG